MTGTTYSTVYRGYRIVTATYDMLYDLNRSYTRVTRLDADGTEPPTPERDYWIDHDTTDPLELCDLHRDTLQFVREDSVTQWVAWHMPAQRPPFDIADSMERVTAINVYQDEVDARPVEGAA